MVGIYVYIKFGDYHGQKAFVVGLTEDEGYPAFLLRLANGEIIVKKQKNTVRMLNK